jgi:hypothetical protein
MSSKRAGLIWADAQGEQVLHVITTATGVGAIETAIAAQSNAGLVECWEGLLEDFTPTPSAATYPSARSVAILLFRDGLGSTARLYVPAPVAGLFNAAGDTVDPTAAAGIIAAAVGNLRAGSGNTVTQFTGGYLSKAPTRAVETTDVAAFVNPMTSTGDIIISTSNTGNAGRLGIGSAGQVLEVVSGLPAWVPAPVGIPLTTLTGYLTSNVTMTSANTFYDGPSVTLSAGKWWLVGSVVISAGITSGQATAKLWDGTTAVSSGITDYGANGDITMGLSGIVTVTGTPTWKISVAEAAVSSSTIQATPRSNNTGLTNTASYLLATLIG